MLNRIVRSGPCRVPTPPRSHTPVLAGFVTDFVLVRGGA
jgi:hypothetical protein